MLGKQSGLGETFSNNSDLSGSDSELEWSVCLLGVRSNLGLVSKSDNEVKSSLAEVQTYKKFDTEKVVPFTSRALVRIRFPKLSLSKRFSSSSQH